MQQNQISSIHTALFIYVVLRHAISCHLLCCIELKMSWLCRMIFCLLCCYVVSSRSQTIVCVCLCHFVLLSLAYSALSKSKYCSYSLLVLIACQLGNPDIISQNFSGTSCRSCWKMHFSINVEWHTLSIMHATHRIVLM